MACNASSIANFFLSSFFPLSLSLFFLTKKRSRKAFSHLCRAQTCTQRYGSHSKLAIYQWHGSPYKRIDQWYNAYAISRPPCTELKYDLYEVRRRLHSRFNLIRFADPGRGEPRNCQSEWIHRLQRFPRWHAIVGRVQLFFFRWSASHLRFVKG